MRNYFTTFGAYHYPFLMNAPDGGGSGGSDEGAGGNQNEPAAGGANKDDAAADLEKKIADAVAAAVSGLRKKNEELIGATKRLKEDLEAAKAKPSLTDDEYTEFTTIKERMSRDTLAKALLEGKTDEVIESVTKRARLDMEAKIAAEKEVAEKATKEADTWRTRFESSLVEAEVAKVVSPLVKPGYGDIVSRMVSEHTRLVDGAVRVVNADGEVEMTASGTKPLGIPEYVEGLRKTFPDLFVASTGGGSGGSTKRAPGSSTKVAQEVAGSLDLDEYTRLRAEGKI